MILGAAGANGGTFLLPRSNWRSQVGVVVGDALALVLYSVDIETELFNRAECVEAAIDCDGLQCAVTVSDDFFNEGGCFSKIPGIIK